MLNNKTLLTPIALAAAMSAGAAQAAEPANGRLAGAVSRVTDALNLDARSANGSASGDMRPATFASRSDDGERRFGDAFARDRNGERGSLLGLAAADRESLSERADERRTYDPQGINLDLSLGNTGDSPDARGPGLQISHDSTLHLRTEEDADSPLDNGDETARSGLETGTSIRLIGSRQNDDGERERVARGVETGMNLFNHAPHEDSDAEAYRSAELSGFVTERRVEDGVIDEDEHSNRRGGALHYDSRDGVSFEGGDDER